MKRWLIVLFVLIVFIGTTVTLWLLREATPGPSSQYVDDILARAMGESWPMEIVAIVNPEWTDMESTDGSSQFHNMTVLGSTPVSTSDANALIQAMRDGIRVHDDGATAACWVPHHGLRLSAPDTVYEFVICFQCIRLFVYSENEQRRGARTTEVPRNAFNSIYEANGLRLAPGAYQ
ncbi:MAG: hypothetical protein AAF432_00830 [Planctomycetota bacterium]